MMKLEVIIGLEIHAQLATSSKMWCGCDNQAFGAEPNTRVCPVCMGFPGMLPVLNGEALRHAVRAATALGCEIQEFSKFDRKNYFYPDLPNGYQISQYDQPLALKGDVEILHKGHHRKIGITRVHLENDAGKLTHDEKKGTLIDFNRAGAPLIEIVTEPELRSPEEARDFAQELQRILRAVGASDADMEKGMMRFDASISLRPEGDKKLYPRAEIKNLNTFSGLAKALEYEIGRQAKLWEKGEAPKEETTRGYDDNTGKTKLMRSKESADDYRYFPEPDLPPLNFTDKDIADLLGEMPELPLAKMTRYRNEFELSEAESLKISEDPKLAEFFEKAAGLSGEPKKSANLILSVILAKAHWNRSDVTPEHVADVVRLISEDRVSSTGGKQIIEAAMETGKNAEDLMRELKLEQVSDDSQIEAWIDEVLEENPETVAQFKSGKDKVIGFLVGQVMKKSAGSANPPVVQKMMKEKLKK